MMLTKPILAALIATTFATALVGGGTAAASSVPMPRPDATIHQDAQKATPGSKDRLQLTFRDGTDVRIRGGKLVSLSGKVDTTGVRAILDGIPGVKLERLFRGSETDLANMKRAAEKRSGKKSPDLNLSFLVKLPKGADIAQLAAALAKMDGVTGATPEPLPVAPPTASYVGNQGYRTAAPTGINVGAASTVAGGTGNRVKIIDIEYDWNINHEDLAKARTGFIPLGTPNFGTYGSDHGTSVLGELIATNNGFGVTGLVPDAGIGMVNALTTAGYEVHNAILLAANNLQPGDVILIEQQIAGPRHLDPGSDVGLMPVEWNLATYNAIRTATAKGVIVVEAAGNGYQNLDDPIYAAAFGPTGRANSGAIMVGAGHAPTTASGPNCGTEPARSRLAFSNYGSRLDLQAWGECIVTTGYGDLASVGGSNALYTYQFGGTSGASPMVTAAAALTSSMIEARTGVAATPSKVLSILKSTGTAQVTGTGTLTGKIGPMPDMARVVASFASDTTAPVVGTVSQAAAAGYLASAIAVPTRISWAATDASGIAAFALKVSTNGGAWANVTLASATATSVVLNLAPASTYTFTVAAKDPSGNWSAWKNGPTISPTLIAENHTAVRYSTGWTQAAYTPAIGGFVKVSGTTGAWASVTFTGRNISWIGTKATTRGQADLWLDGTYLGRIDLYSATTSPATVLFSRNVTTGVTHNLQLQVVGTSGRPKLDIDGFAILK